eukprot:TRINITY_DN16873_c0_g1_i4.p1 TRINITY_DN16873_c0_g1~~TRINITY_DN16873_c0_g1_i4.p1  ORF type:complete len:325 (-),score=82.86 TRINITY_DN16873_c0_g1_i4:376-1350(-)
MSGQMATYTGLATKEVDPEFQTMVRRELKAAMVARGCEDVEPLRTAIEAASEAKLDSKEIGTAKVTLDNLENEIAALAFTDVSRLDMEVMQAATSRAEVRKKLGECMHLGQDGLKSEVLGEFHFHNFMFCQKRRFSPEKASAFLSIMRVLHSHSVVQKKMEEHEARKLLEDLLIRHMRQLPPFSVGIFSEEEVTAIRDYASRTFFRHFSMYAYMYTQRKDLVVRMRQMSVVPKVVLATSLHKAFEIDPTQVPELADLLKSEEAADGEEQGKISSKASSSKAPSKDRPKRKGPQSEHEAAVLAAIDEAVTARLGNLEDRLNLPVK